MNSIGFIFHHGHCIIFQVFENSGWNACLDHIHLTIGKHTSSLQQLEESVEAMTKLLGPSKQLPAQQESHLRDYIGTLQASKRENRGK